MFTGIISEIGTVNKVKHTKDSSTFLINAAKTARQLEIGSSVSINGVCHTVTSLHGDDFKITSVPETLTRTNMGTLIVGSPVNLELPLRVNDRFDGHIVQGHVDITATVSKIQKNGNQVSFSFTIAPEALSYIIKKGSVTVNGVSLTVTEVTKNFFSVAVIPHTFSHTNFSTLKKGSVVNIEFDYLARYLEKRLMEGKKAAVSKKIDLQSATPLTKKQLGGATLIEGTLSGKDLCMAIILPRFNEVLGKQLLVSTLDALRKYAVDDKNIDIVRVPGAFEIPATAQKLITYEQYDCIIALGVVIRGETSHYDQICNTVAEQISAISVKTGVPIIHGIVTTETVEQAVARINGTHGNKGADSARAALEMATLFKKLSSQDRITHLRTWNKSLKL